MPSDADKELTWKTSTSAPVALAPSTTGSVRAAMCPYKDQTMTAILAVAILEEVVVLAEGAGAVLVLVVAAAGAGAAEVVEV